MILKKMTAVGFKSFADKLELDFGPGITCVVGPNGCGKSNVVDAIKWVLGEQSAKSLRGKQMMDVIFNGSGTRKPGSMAQIDLTFDNSDGTLPIDQAEVTVSRRLYRSGESEYLMNKNQCRLKDVRELFLDTGIGVDAYSMVEQGRVDSLLQANPQDRRTIFEEAAGINKYKARKKEALRRLERVDQNLQRVQDIVEEVEKRLRSVKLAAGKARNYQSYTQQLRELRSKYALAEFHRLKTGAASLGAEVDQFSDQATSARTELSNVEAKASDANVRIVDLEREIGIGDKRLLTVQSEVTAHEERAISSEQRIGDQTALLERSRERLAGFDQQMNTLETRLAEEKKTAESIEVDLAAVHDELVLLQERDHAAAQELHTKQRNMEDEKRGVMELLRRSSQLRNEINTCTIQHEHLSGQKQKLDDRDAIIANELTGVMARQHELQSQLAGLDQLLTDQKQKIEETKGRIAEIAEHRAQLLEQIAAAKAHRSAMEGRRQALEEMDRRHEGLMAGPREVLARRDAAAAASEAPPAKGGLGGCLEEEAAPADGSHSTAATHSNTPPSPPLAGGEQERPPFWYVRGAIGELFEADVAHASLVEAVLGAQQQSLVVERRDDLLADLVQFEEVGGRVQVYCLDSVAPPLGGPDMSGQPGYVATLLDWVRHPDDCDRLAKFLLGRTYVVESIEHARQMMTLDNGGARYVTLDGVVIEPTGRVSVGPLAEGTGMISRRGELRELAKNLEEVDRRITDLNGQLAEKASEAGHLEAIEQELRQANHDTSTQRVGTQSQLGVANDQIRRLSEERPLIASEVAQIVRRLDEAQTKSEAGKQSLSELDAKNTESERIIEQLQADITRLTEQRQAMITEVTTARVKEGKLRQRRSLLADLLRDLEATRIQMRADREKAEHDVAEAQRRIEQSREQIAQARASLEQLQAERDELTTRLAALRRDRDDLRQLVEQCSIDARRLRSEIERVEGELHERQMKLQEIRVRLEDMVTRIADELKVNLEEQYATYVPQEEEDWPAVEAAIEELRAKIERLGNVNLDAITEQEELEQREQFLSGQMKDLRESEQQLNALIEKLNHESIQRFMETFRAVQGHFSQLFKKLFGGGKAEINLLDPNDVLESGIEIVARPPGKEPQNISLLSGGERTMTAIALLMAVFRSRPSPFVLLDEVDAALDEANNLRFNHVIREFSQQSQFIVITHSKRTMSMADMMYGITMQEAGVSKRVSVRFEDERKDVA